MFSHLLAGELVFLVLGYAFGFNITPKFLFFGALCGFLPDILSIFLKGKSVKVNKWYHKHRDNFSHSVFLPITIFLFLFFWIDIYLNLLIFLAIASHMFLDMWGIGWGIKLFLPFSDKVYKLFYDKKIIKKFKSEKERESHIKKHGRNDWFKAAYFFTPDSGWLKWWGVFEWISLALAIFLLLFYSLI